ncbi:MAG: hypothetical protein QOI55_2299 [Actinomycetota bacterium]|nr:hypothetical protein [Actinomycetota bacterium]
MTGTRERLAQLPRSVRVVIAVVAALVLVNIGARALDQSVGGSEPTGAPSSSFATTPAGLAAYAELLRRWDHPITRQRGNLVDAAIPRSATLMILDPEFLGDTDAGEALQFVVDGGRLVIGGSEPDRYLHALRDHPPKWTASGPTTITEMQPPFDGITGIEANGDGAWTAPGTSTPLVGNAHDALLTHERVGRGEILFIADVSPLSNAFLARADNAAFALLLAGDDGRPVVFAEGVHGYGASRGLAAIPQRWKLALAGLGLAALVLIWARGRRLGPPEDAERTLPPPRRAYVDALAATLERTHDRNDAVAPVRDAVRTRIARRAGLAPDASPADIDRAGQSLGFDDDERRVLVRGATNDDDVVTIGRALARAARWDSGRDE